MIIEETEPKEKTSMLVKLVRGKPHCFYLFLLLSLLAKNTSPPIQIYLVTLTLTYNLQWNEIYMNLMSYKTPSDRPDLVSRVLHEKLSSLLEDLTRKMYLL